MTIGKGPEQSEVLFSEATAVERLNTHTYRVSLSDTFCIGTVPNGGYTASCVLAAASLHLSAQNQPDTLTAHIEYISRVSAEPAIIIVEEIKLGRSLSTLHLTLWQDALLSQSPWITTSVSRRVVTAYATLTNLRTFSGLSLKTGYQTLPASALPSQPNFEALESSPDADALWAEAKLPKSSAFARSLRKWRFYLPRSGTLSPGVVDTWLRLASGERITQAVVPFALDTFPYNIITLLTAPNIRRHLEAPGDKQGSDETQGDQARRGMWFPTVVMNLEVKKMLPEQGVECIALRITSKQIQDGRMDIGVEMRDVQGDLVALSNQVALILSLERNLAKRGSSKSSL